MRGLNDVLHGGTRSKHPSFFVLEQKAREITCFFLLYFFPSGLVEENLAESVSLSVLVRVMDNGKGCFYLFSTKPA